MLTPTVIAYDAELQDLLAGFSLYKRTCKKAGKSMRNIRFFAALWVLACCWGFATQTSVRTSPIAIGLTVAGLYIILIVPWQERRSYKKLWRKLVTPPADTLPIRVSFDEEQIAFLLTGKSEARFYWAAIVGIAEDDLIFLLLVAERQFYYIPKRILSEEILTSLRNVAPISKEFKC